VIPSISAPGQLLALRRRSAVVDCQASTATPKLALRSRTLEQRQKSLPNNHQSRYIPHNDCSDRLYAPERRYLSAPVPTATVGQCTADGAAAHGASQQQQITKRNNAAYKIAASTRSSRPDQKRNTSSQLRKAKSVASACGRDGGCRQRRQSRVGGSAMRAELPVRATCATAHARRIRCRAKADQPEHQR
jgi:hypothetical protein